MLYRTLTIISTSDGCQNDSLKGPYMIGVPLGVVKGFPKDFYRHIYQFVRPAARDIFLSRSAWAR
jgi:hypothetical protein